MCACIEDSIPDPIPGITRKVGDTDNLVAVGLFKLLNYQCPLLTYSIS